MKITTKKENTKLFDQAEKTHLKIREKIVQQARNTSSVTKAQPKGSKGNNPPKEANKLAFN